jgi:hypothetical protein
MSTTTTTTKAPRRAPAKATAKATTTKAAPRRAAKGAARKPGDVLGVTATRYPEVDKATPLWCAGHGDYHPAGRFQPRGKLGTGAGRVVNCTAYRNWREDENRARVARGEEPLPVPRLPEGRVAPAV